MITPSPEHLPPSGPSSRLLSLVCLRHRIDIFFLLRLRLCGFLRSLRLARGVLPRVSHFVFQGLNEPVEANSSNSATGRTWSKLAMP